MLLIFTDWQVETMMNKMIKAFGGRKSFTFLVTLGAVCTLSAFNKASTEVLGLIDTLYLVYAGANVAAKKKENKTNEQ
jgi:hypothetical protein